MECETNWGGLSTRVREDMGTWTKDGGKVQGIGEVRGGKKNVLHLRYELVLSVESV